MVFFCVCKCLNFLIFVLFSFKAGPYLFTAKRKFCQQHLQMANFMDCGPFGDRNRYFTIVPSFRNFCRKLLLLTLRGNTDAGRDIIAVFFFFCWCVLPRKVSVGEGSVVSVEEVAFCTIAGGILNLIVNSWSSN